MRPVDKQSSEDRAPRLEPRRADGYETKQWRLARKAEIAGTTSPPEKSERAKALAACLARSSGTVGSTEQTGSTRPESQQCKIQPIGYWLSSRRDDGRVGL